MGEKKTFRATKINEITLFKTKRETFSIDIDSFCQKKIEQDGESF